MAMEITSNYNAYESTYAAQKQETAKKQAASGNETLEVFNEEYFEKLSQEEIEELMSNADEYMCKQGFLDGIRHIFGIWNIDNGDQCELSHYIDHLIKTKEKDTRIETISPGYFMTALYYAFDTQNRDENGDLYLNPNDFIENNGSTEEAQEVNDLDAITTILAAKVYKQDDLVDLLDNYILHENLSGSDRYVKRADGSFSLVKGYYYRVWTYFPPTTPGGKGYWACVDHTSSKYEVDEKKYKLYLRYGQKVVDEYVNELNENTAYDKTSSECQIWTKHDLSKYETMADPDTLENDNAKITISSGTYGYDSGFIFTTYPKYDTKYSIDNKVDYDYKVDKDIEQIIRNTETRQDYTNYILGYPSNVKTELSISGYGGTSCTYNLDGVDMSNIKVKLLHGKSDVPGVNRFDPIEGQELIDFERYILGVVYGEVGGFSDETLRTQAIAARSYALARVKAMSGLSLTEENGQWILTMRNSNEDQAFCDPDKGCSRCEGYNTVFTKGTEPSGAVCKEWKPALPTEHQIRNALKEVEGMIITDSSGKPVHASYNSTIQKGWEEQAKQGKDYVEILRNQYPGTTVTTNKCTVGTNGWIWPTDSGWRITSYFGYRGDIGVAGATTYHQGVDIAGFPMDSPIYAIGNGTVSGKGYQSSMGNYIKVDHGNGYESVYMHMNKHLAGLEIGDEVYAGQQIGYMGTTGASSGVHLHLGIKLNGQYVNPLEVIGLPNSKGWYKIWKTEVLK